MQLPEPSLSAPPKPMGTALPTATSKTPLTSRMLSDLPPILLFVTGTSLWKRIQSPILRFALLEFSHNLQLLRYKYKSRTRASYDFYVTSY